MKNAQAIVRFKTSLVLQIHVLHHVLKIAPDVFPKRNVTMRVAHGNGKNMRVHAKVLNNIERFFVHSKSIINGYTGCHPISFIFKS